MVRTFNSLVLEFSILDLCIDFDMLVFLQSSNMKNSILRRDNGQGSIFILTVFGR